jgi:hypothetical protein
MNLLALSALSPFHLRILGHVAFVAGLVIPLAFAYGPALEAHINRSMDPFIFNDDARQQIFPFFQYHEPGLFAHDYFGTYLRACFLPPGYCVFYKFGAMAMDPAAISKVLPYLLLAVTVIAVAVAAYRLAGYFGALLAAALVLSSEMFLSRLAGGLPRAFAFPTAALTAAALVYGRPRLLAGLVCASAGFYPATAMLSAIALVLWLFILPATDRGQAAEWSFTHRACLAVATASISALILLPMIVGAWPYGRQLGPADITEYPELGQGGRYGGGDLLGFNSFPKTAFHLTRQFFTPTGKPWLEAVQSWMAHPESGPNSNRHMIIKILTVALLVGCVFVAARGSAERRFFLLGAAAWLGHFVARSLAPHFFLPERYAVYSVPIVLVVLVPAVGAAIGTQLFGRRFPGLAQPLGVIAIAAMILLPFGGRGSIDAGLDIDVKPQQQLYNFLGQLPKDALIAGWPADLDNVPYASRRQAFITHELHHVFHQGYADEMRRRMRALIDAYFASDQAPLDRLRDKFGVTHLIVQRSRLEKPPEYFEPFSAWIQRAFDEGQAKGFEIQRQLGATMMFSDGPYIVLDLRRLSTP